MLISVISFILFHMWTKTINNISIPGPYAWSVTIYIYSPTKYLLRRNNELLLEPHNGKTKKTLGDGAFATVTF